MDRCHSKGCLKAHECGRPHHLSCEKPPTGALHFFSSYTVSLSMLISNVLLYYHSNVRNIEPQDINRSHQKVVVIVSLLFFVYFINIFVLVVIIFVVHKTILILDQKKYQASLTCPIALLAVF